LTIEKNYDHAQLLTKKKRICLVLQRRFVLAHDCRRVSPPARLAPFGSKATEQLNKYKKTIMNNLKTSILHPPEKAGFGKQNWYSIIKAHKNNQQNNCQQLNTITIANN